MCWCVCENGEWVMLVVWAARVLGERNQYGREEARAHRCVLNYVLGLVMWALTTVQFRFISFPFVSVRFDSIQVLHECQVSTPSFKSKKQATKMNKNLFWLFCFVHFSQFAHSLLSNTDTSDISHCVISMLNVCLFQCHKINHVLPLSTLHRTHIIITTVC